LADLLDAVRIAPPPATMGTGRHLGLDRGDDAFRLAATSGYTSRIPIRASTAPHLPTPGHPDPHAPRRWVVAVAHSRFIRLRRLLVRREKEAEHYLGFVHLAAFLIICRKLRQPCSPYGQALIQVAVSILT
jgi:hypothetical protein